MGYIELLTMESYLETKKDVIENGGYTLKELNIEHGERIEEIIREIYDAYFEKKGDGEQEAIVRLGFEKKGTSYEVWTINENYQHRDSFLCALKSEYERYMQVDKEWEIIEYIERAITTVFSVSSNFYDDVIKKTYEIIKYTLTKDAKCNYKENGDFIEEMYKKEDEDDEVIFPFEIENEEITEYCKKMQRVLFGVHRKIFINSRKNKVNSDITRFSFYNVNKIVKAVIDDLKEENSENNKGENKVYVEGIEDYIVLDEILGITLTNIIYWKTRKITEREKQDNIIEVVSYLAKCRCSIGKNFVAQVLMDYFEAVDYNSKIIQEIGVFLKKEIRRWDEYYEEIEAVGLCSLFNFLKGCSDSELIEVCKDIQKDYWTEYMYMREIAENEDMMKVDDKGKYKKEEKIRIPKGSMDNRTWYAYIHKTVFESIWN